MLLYAILSLCFIITVSCESNHELHILTNSTNDCNEMRDKFAIALSDFINCSIVSAQPVILCENCADTYHAIVTNYTLLSHVNNNDSAETTCIDNFINLDRLQILSTLYKNANDLWTKAKCSACVRFNENGTHTATKIGQIFHEKYEIFYNCTRENNSANITKFCTMCFDKYMKLNEYYFGIGDITHGIEDACMDIVDLMNKTQSHWSKTCCHYREKDEMIYIIVTSFMCLLPLLFYTLVKLFVDVKRPTLLQQNRFAESMNTPSTSYRR